jgi:hypothetical protein
MNRNQAVTVIKEIFDKCHLIEGKAIKLMPPKENNALSDTYRIHIQTGDNESLISCVQGAVKRHNLAIKQTKGSLIVYKPYPNMSEPF